MLLQQKDIIKSARVLLGFRRSLVIGHRPGANAKGFSLCKSEMPTVLCSHLGNAIMTAFSQAV